jgi:hypothetical protein
LNAIPVFHEARTKLELIEEQTRLMNQSGYVADMDRPRSKEELSVVAKGKGNLQDDLMDFLKLAQMRFEEGTLSDLDISQIERSLSQVKLEKELFEQRAKVALPAAELKNVSTNLDTIELVRTSLIRFGGVTVILFLASLLTPIYRYNVRLGTFFQARADTLLLSKDLHVENFPEMLRLLTPAYGFEKEPTTPVESLAAFAKEAAGGIIKKT